jgi:hypothetical protein
VSNFVDTRGEKHLQDWLDDNAMDTEDAMFILRRRRPLPLSAADARERQQEKDGGGSEQPIDLALFESHVDVGSDKYSDFWVRIAKG